jgi:hypothetical protein
MGASTDDVPALSSLDRVVRTIDTTTDALFSQDGQELLKVLATRATTLETAVTDMSTISRAKSLRAGKSDHEVS